MSNEQELHPLVEQILDHSAKTRKALDQTIRSWLEERVREYEVDEIGYFQNLRQILGIYKEPEKTLDEKILEAIEKECITPGIPYWKGYSKIAARVAREHFGKEKGE